ncbi:large conductance mechanosensitive channel protein MscL [Flavobacterium sp. CS20]|uniref:large conductance mechanosensitive channel protein MscL n=1 Tax=Flavobacterium sp. CS20 TaxID=2775246 RepID=UPI001B3A3E0C|nr:large conductance mechanosensitive channel protein MscL [Flavobacterium sp. CS20]QTY27860.1 large conductance mechanosensitive channel protein MscL [Flavobacterium sp. CS20]
MKLIKEFKEFAVKGNMIDMAIGIIIGMAFNKVVDVLVKQIILPPLSLLTSGINFSNKKIILREAVTNSENTKIIDEVSIAYGTLIEVILNFIIIGFVMFIVVKMMNRLRQKSENEKDKTVITPKNIESLSDLKQLIKEQNELLKSKSKP